MFQLKLESVGGIFIKLGEILTMKKQKIIALTGPIAAGKNAVADIFLFLLDFIDFKCIVYCFLIFSAFPT